MIVMGIDPGASGALAWIDTADGDLSIAEMPWLTGHGVEPEKLRTLILRADHVFVEEAWTRPGEGGKSARTSMVNFGIVCGVVIGLSRSLYRVAPQRWKAAMGLTLRKAEPKAKKAASIALAMKMFPQVSFYRTERCKAPSDGFADAAMIAEYGRRLLVGGLKGGG